MTLAVTEIGAAIWVNRWDKISI